MADSSTTELEAVLIQFEKAVLSPVVPGELSDWTKEAFERTEELPAVLAENAKSVHDEICDTISVADPEMLPRIESLHAEDDAIIASARELLEMAKTVRTVAGSVVPDEERARKLVDGFTTAASALIIRVKKQELGIEVWLRESQTRDRGVKD
jgi:hypothetical protein